MSYIRLPIGHTVNVGGNDYIVSEYIDHGGYSNVWLLSDGDGNDNYVMKVFRTDEDYDKWAKAEIDILNLVKTEDDKDTFSIIKAIGDLTVDDPKTGDTHHAVILPYRDCDLYGFLKEHKPIKFDLAKKITIEMIKGFYFLHKKGIIHGDIKLDNILIRDCILDESSEITNRIDITDFSLSIRYLDRVGGKSNHNDYYHRLIYDNYHLQTLEYKSPEIICQSGFNTTVDTWAFGVMIYKLLTGKFPFRYDDLEDFNESSESDSDDESFDSADESAGEIEQDYMQANYIMHDIFAKLAYTSEDIKHLKKGNHYYKYFDKKDRLHFGFPKQEHQWAFLKEIETIYLREGVSKPEIEWFSGLLKRCFKINVHSRSTFKDLFNKFVIESN
jgi:serine/threonine protein kinase